MWRGSLAGGDPGRRPAASALAERGIAVRTIIILPGSVRSSIVRGKRRERTAADSGNVAVPETGGMDCAQGFPERPIRTPNVEVEDTGVAYALDRLSQDKLRSGRLRLANASSGRKRCCGGKLRRRIPERQPLAAFPVANRGGVLEVGVFDAIVVEGRRSMELVRGAQIAGAADGDIPARAEDGASRLSSQPGGVRLAAQGDRSLELAPQKHVEGGGSPYRAERGPVAAARGLERTVNHVFRGLGLETLRNHAAAAAELDHHGGGHFRERGQGQEADAVANAATRRRQPALLDVLEVGVRRELRR